MNETLYGTRNARGEWTPTRRASFGPLFEWPTKPGRILRWFFGVPGYLLPWNVFYFGAAMAIYFFATPSSTTMKTWGVEWIAAILVRNLVLVVVWYGLFHYRLYRRRAQDTRFKYNARWPRTSDRFTFGSQTRENVAWSLLSGVPITLPALLRAYEYGNRAAAVGFDWSHATDVMDKIEEEVRELREVVGQVEQVARVEEEMGDLLFAIANLSRKLGVEPEAALRRANDKFRDRFGHVEARITARGERMQDKSLDELDAEWRAVKAGETR